MSAPEPPKKSKQVGGEHYAEGVKTSPWDLQRELESSGNVFVDGRRCDAIRYAARLKGKGDGMLRKLAEDLRKAADCANAGADYIEARLLKPPAPTFPLTFWHRDGITSVRRGAIEGTVSYNHRFIPGVTRARKKLPKLPPQPFPHQVPLDALKVLTLHNKKQLEITDAEIINLFHGHAEG